MHLKLGLVLVAIAVALGLSAWQFTPPASATIDGDIGVGDNVLDSGQSTPITINLESATTETTRIEVTADVDDSDASATLTDVICSPDTPCSFTGEDSSAVSVTTDNLNSITMTLAVTCDIDATFTITAEPEEPDETTTTVDCIAPIAENPLGIASVVVTASPNVVACNGTSIITATARDAEGHVIPGVGFHFVTDVGLLIVSPNDAATESGIASLTLQSGMPSATVRVSVGANIGERERQVNVQQFCPGAPEGLNASAAPGVIALNQSNDTLVCGEQAFVGLHVRDSKGELVPDGTVVNLLATNGVIEPATATTVNGAANVTYTAPAINGDVRITAAAGDSFGFTILHVKCATSSGTGGATGGGAAPCVPIGDGVCITPPNTGEGGGSRITPPNTGDGGLR